MSQVGRALRPWAWSVVAGLALTVPAGCSTPVPQAPAERTVTSTPPPSPSPSTSLSTAPAAVSPTGAPGRRSWSWTSTGQDAVQPLAGAVSAVEQASTGQWFVVRPDGRASNATVTRAGTLAVVDGRLEATAQAGAAAVREQGGLLSARWTSRDGVRSLRVEPVAAARGWATPRAADALWAELVAVDATADTPGMRDQLVCHLHFAPRKAAWYLEPARPAVGYPATVAARCNPGDVTDGG